MLASPVRVSQRPYRPRAAASGLLHRLVREHLATFLQLRPDLPRHVAEAFEGFLDCGILHFHSYLSDGVFSRESDEAAVV